MKIVKNTIAERIFDFLKNFPPFDVLEKEELFEISESVKIIYKDSGDIIFEQEEESKDLFYVVNEGAVGLFRVMDEEEILVDICDEGDLFGLRPVIQLDKYRMTARAKEESILYAISVEKFKALIDSNENVKKFILASFSNNIKRPYLENHNTSLFNSNQDNSSIIEVRTAEYSKKPIVCTAETSIKNAALKMSEHKVGSIIIVENEKPIGIITDKDLRLKIATGLVSIEALVGEIMSSPVICFPENISVAEAQIAMIKHRITHLCITQDGSVDSKLKGILSEHDLVVLQGNNPSVLIKELKRAKDVKPLVEIRKRATSILSAYLEQDISILFVSNIMSAFNDAITRKIIQFSLAEMNEPAPVEFAWLALGSQGRKEQLLITDQDNALVFEDVAEEDYEKTQTYFLELAQKITQKLNEVGYVFCPADMMGSNPKWCMSLSNWKTQFDDWITKPSEESILMGTIFFDYNFVYGKEQLVYELTESIHDAIDSYEIFLNFLGRNALLNPPPVGFFRQFIVENNGEHKDLFDLKSRALMPLIDAARLLSLSHKLKGKVNTIDRFEALIKLEPQNKEIYLSCIDSFKILLRYRTRQGLKHQDSGRFVELKNLTKSEKLKLRACFNPIQQVQELLSVRFKLSQMM